MGNFINLPRYSKRFYPHQELNISNVGYSDFNFTEPAKMFRTQNFYTWHFVLSGSGVLEIYDKIHHIKTGEMFFIPPHTKMKYFPDEDSPWEYVWFAIDDKKVEDYSNQAGFSKENPVCKMRDFKRIDQVLKRLFDMFIEEECGYYQVLACFYEIMDISTESSALTEIQQVKKLIDESFMNPDFSIENLCHDVGISHCHLLRLFKESYNTTLIKYILKKRIDFACELLRTTNLSVSSVAYSCGFSDEIHFMKTFKKATNMSALQYKKDTKTLSARKQSK